MNRFLVILFVALGLFLQSNPSFATSYDVENMQWAVYVRVPPALRDRTNRMVSDLIERNLVKTYVKFLGGFCVEIHSIGGEHSYHAMTNLVAELERDSTHMERWKTCLQKPAVKPLDPNSPMFDF